DMLLLSVLDEFEQREREVMTPLVQSIELSREDPDEAWHATIDLLRRMVTRFAQRPDLARFVFTLQAEALDRAHIAHGWFRKREQLTLDLFDSLLAGFVPDSLSAARHLVSTMQGLGQHWLRQDMSFELIGEWDKLLGLVLRRNAPRSRKGAHALSQ